MADAGSTSNAPANPTSQPNDAMDQDPDPELDSAIDPAPAPADPGNPELEAPLPETREPTRKDISLREFLGKMDDYAPIIPDAVTHHHLLLAGLPPHTTPLPLARLLALATQKFIADIAADAYQYSRMRTSATGAGQPSAATQALQQQQQQQQPAADSQGGGKKDEKAKGGAHVLGVQRAGYGGGGGGGGQGGRAVLTMEDLGCAVGEYGVNVKRGEFYR